MYIDFVSANLFSMDATLIRDDEIIALPPLGSKALADGDTHIYIWCHNYGRTELEALAKDCRRPDLNEVFAESRDKRFVEKVSVRLLLHKLLGKEAEIDYNADGSPRLTKAAAEISVSHTAEAYALSLSQWKHGIDIESWGAKALKVRRAFLNESENDWVESLPGAEAEQTATLLWSAKESLYKLLRTEGLSFKDQLTFTSNSEDLLEATVYPSGERITVECQRMPRFALTCCAENISH